MHDRDGTADERMRARAQAQAGFPCWTTPGTIRIGDHSFRDESPVLYWAKERLSSTGKRFFDILFVIAMLPVLLPLIAIIAVLIWAISPGPIVFCQQRSGHRARPFVCYKFRTMEVDAERRLLDEPALCAAYATGWKLTADPRVTDLGKWLRRTSLDELPQFWNVLRGDMSLVGPRPVLDMELQEAYGAAAVIVTGVRPGLTGLWQVSGRSLRSYEERVALDLAYIRRRSFWFDCYLILLTIPAVLRMRGAV